MVTFLVLCSWWQLAAGQSSSSGWEHDVRLSLLLMPTCTDSQGTVSLEWNLCTCHLTFRKDSGDFLKGMELWAFLHVICHPQPGQISWEQLLGTW